MSASGPGSITDLIIPAANLGILVGFLGYKLKEPLVQFTRGRHAHIRHEIKSVADELHKAKEKFEDFSLKLKKISQEAQMIREQSVTDARTLKEKIVSDSKRLSSNIVSDAQAGTSAMVQELKTQLRVELGERVLSRAEEIIRKKLTTDDHTRLSRDFSKQMGSLS